MPQDKPHSAPILQYATPRVAQKPRRWWLFAALVLALFVCANRPRLTPPGWPTASDYVAMLLIPIGGVVLATMTSLPGWVIGFYGALSVCLLVPGQLADRRLKFRLDDSSAACLLMLEWCLAVLLAWAFCRLCVLLRRPTVGGPAKG